MRHLDILVCLYRIVRSVRLVRSIVAAALGSLAVNATAQSSESVAPPSEADAPVTAQDAKELAPVVVKTRRLADTYTVPNTDSATKLNLSPRETPQSISIITRERIEDQNLDSMRTVLDNTAGIYSNAYDSERVIFYTRGFVIDTLMYDGVPALTNFSTDSIDETLDTALYERIEIVRGATGLMTGAGSPAASVNVVRKHAHSRTPIVSANVTLGSWSERRLELDVTTPLNADGSVRGRVVVAAEDKESYQDLYRKEKYVVSGIVDADVTASTRVSLGFDHLDNRPRSNTWGSFPLYLGDGQLADWPDSVTTAPDWTYWNRKTQTVFGEVRHRFDDGWSLRSTLSHRIFKEDLELFYVFGYPDPFTGEGLDPYVSKSKARIGETSLDVYASGPFQLLGREHELVAGYNGSRSKHTGKEYAAVSPLAPPGNFFEWDGSYPRPQFSAEGTRLHDTRIEQDGVYTVARFQLADTVKAIAGARYASWKIDSYYLYDSPADSEYDFNKVIPYAGLVWDVLPNVSAFGSYTRIFKPQNEREADGRYLDPNEGRSVEVGIKGEHFDRKLNTSLTLFETKQTNVAAPLLDEDGEPVLLPDGSAASRAIDGTRTRGFELEAAGRLSDEWQGTLGWTRYIMKDDDGEAVRTYIPSTLLRVFATWDPRSWSDRVRLGGGVNWQSASRTPVGSPDGPTELRQSSVTQVSLMARYLLSPNASIQLNANNVFDRKFYVLDEYDNTYYGEPRNVSVTLRLSL